MNFQNTFNKPILGMALLFLMHCSSSKEIYPLSIDQAYANLPLTGQNNISAYMNIDNNSGEELRIIGVNCKDVKLTQFHNTTINLDNQLVQMKMEDSLTLEKNQKKILKRGGRHLMLMEIDNTLIMKDSIFCEFIIESYANFSFEITLKK